MIKTQVPGQNLVREHDRMLTVERVPERVVRDGGLQRDGGVGGEEKADGEEEQDGKR